MSYEGWSYEGDNLMERFTYADDDEAQRRGDSSAWLERSQSRLPKLDSDKVGNWEVGYIPVSTQDVEGSAPYPELMGMSDDSDQIDIDVRSEDVDETFEQIDAVFDGLFG